MISWGVVSRSRDGGVLSIGNVKARNTALVGKWLWRFSFEVNSMWHLVIKSKYGLHANG